MAAVIRDMANLTNKVNRPNREPNVEWRRDNRMPG